MEAGTFSPEHLSWLDALARTVLSVAFALAIGVERFIHRKPVDFRPYVIISVASCALSIAVLELGYRAVDPHISVDPTRVIGGVMSGIGFLGAGALFREKAFVHGSGTAAAIWASGAIGIVCGMGFLWLGGIVAITIVALFLFARWLGDPYESAPHHDDQP